MIVNILIFKFKAETTKSSMKWYQNSSGVSKPTWSTTKSRIKMNFVSSTMVDFCENLGILTKFILVVHPQVNRQTESSNTVILGRIRTKLDEARGFEPNNSKKFYGHIIP